MPVVYHVLFAAALMPYVLAGLGAYYRVRQFGVFDNNHPRQQQAALQGPGARVHAAQANSWEALLVFAVSVFIAFAAGVDPRALDAVSVVFIVSRVIYALLYVANLGWPRSAVFGIGISCCTYIFVLAVMRMS